MKAQDVLHVKLRGHLRAKLPMIGHASLEALTTNLVDWIAQDEVRAVIERLFVERTEAALTRSSTR
jgi:hypothetical protein